MEKMIAYWVLVLIKLKLIGLWDKFSLETSIHYLIENNRELGSLSKVNLKLNLIKHTLFSFKKRKEENQEKCYLLLRISKKIMI
jgi:hypothetical protein